MSRLAWCVLALAALALTGCSTVRITDPPRTATEQFLLSGAAGKAVEQLTFDALRDRVVFVDPAYFAASSQEFVIGELRAALLLAGARLATKREEAQIVLEVRSGGVGIDRYESLLGIPSIVVPQGSTGGTGVPNVATLITPELAILKDIKLHGIASVAFVAYWADTGEVVYSSGPYVGRTLRADFWFMGFGPRTVGDIPPAQVPE